MPYKVKLELFEGPLDILLHLIKKNEIDIYNIPIAEITRQYLGYIELMRSLDLNIAGEYLVMAATLMHIKSKMLLPDEAKDEETEEEDPRADLVRRLLEYQKFKQAALHLEEREMRQKNVFVRSQKQLKRYGGGKDKEIYFEASIFDLISAFSGVLEKIPKEKFQEVIKDEFTVSGKIHELLHMLMEKETIYIKRLFKKAKNKLEIVALFLAILELVRLGEIVTIQQRPFGEIQIRRNVEKIQPNLRNSMG